MRINTPELDLMTLVSLGDEYAFETVVNQSISLVIIQPEWKR